MDNIDIRIEKSYSYPIGFTADVAHFFINGRNLIGLIHDIEIKQKSDYHGPMYTGLPAEDILPPSKHLLDEPNPKYVYRNFENKRMILTCLCGVKDCNCFLVKTTMGTNTITWSDFENPTMTENLKEDALDYSELEFVFERKQYESALLERDYFETINSFQHPFNFKPYKW